MGKWIIALIILVAGGGAFVFSFFQQSSNYTKTVVEIPSGHSLRKIAGLLEKEGVLKDTWPILVLAKITGTSQKIRSGEFEFRKPSSPGSALYVLRYGVPFLHKVTIPEGTSAKEMMSLFEEAKIISAADLYSSSKDPSILKKLDISSNQIEGYLFPSTYRFPRNEKPYRIFEAMVKELKRNLKKRDQQKAKNYGWSLHDWLTFASIIEKETGKKSEYELVSSVFHNRLKKGMRLQSDPTVIYGIKNFDGNIRKKDLTTDHPYNTYTRHGLPPGPITNPGAGAIHAAVNPAETDYFYFVANKKGEHVFTKTYKEHLKAVEKYQLR